MNHTTVPTPTGPLTIVATDTGAIRAAGFTDEVTQVVPPGSGDLHARRDLGDISKAVAAYFDGDLTAVDQLPVEPPPAGEFHAVAWRALREIPPGVPATYTRLAAAAGRPAAVRAAANACARNEIALFVPCHRVVTTGGGLGGYRWGTDVKRWLLRHEAAAAG